MKDSVKLLARSALLTALAAALLYFSAIIPTGKIALVAVSGLVSAAAVIHCGLPYGFAVFAVTAVVGALIVPLKSCVILYAAFLGYYPVVKSLLERLKNRFAEWAGKLLLFNISLTAIWFLGRSILLSAGMPENLQSFAVLVYILMNLAFAVYDIGISKLISFYIIRISKHIDRQDGRRI